MARIIHGQAADRKFRGDRSTPGGIEPQSRAPLLAGLVPLACFVQLPGLHSWYLRGAEVRRDRAC